jgi:hypothetical protein
MAAMGDMVAGWGTLIVETIAKVRRAYFIHKKPIKAICRESRLSRNVGAQGDSVRSDEVSLRGSPADTAAGDPWREQLDRLLFLHADPGSRLSADRHLSKAGR